jgi:2-polyprenyl-3-methyl-5-hydroxy-6-metoxy-1,4-benzoquinol methylase
MTRFDEREKDVPLRRLERCPLCESADARVVRTESHSFPPEAFFEPYTRRSVHLRRCGACDFVFVDELPTDPRFFEHIYASSADWDAELHHHGKRAIHADIKRRLLENGASGRLLDVGAFNGSLLHEFSDAFEVHGVEIGSAASADARSRGLDVRTGAFGTVDLGDLTPFDVVTFVDVLEHLPDPGRMISSAAEVLRQGGLLLIKVPHYRAQASKQDLLRRALLSTEGVAPNYVHINHFSPGSLGRCLEQRGFSVIELVGARAEEWNLEVPMEKQRRMRRRLANLARRATTAALNALMVAGVPVALNLQALARKR